jgi:glycosyltransferase involved in cell wall biosynthesis
VDVNYWIAGSGPDRKNVEATIRKLGLGDQVKMMGSLDEQQVLELLQASDVFLLPSVGAGEASPVAVMEAMACGLPVISSIIGGTPDMITNDIDGILVQQRDEAALAAAIQRLYNSQDLRTRLGEAARRRAVEMFDCRRTARLLLNAILSSTEQHTGAALSPALQH